MEIKDEKLSILTADKDEAGNKLEPEEKPAQRALAVETPVHDTLGRPVGKFNSQVHIEMPAGQLATGFRSVCSLCRHFDVEASRRWIRQKSGTKDGIIELNRWRAYLVGSGNAAVHQRDTGQDGEVDVEHALMSCGICHVLTEAANEPMVMYPAACCPPFVDTENKIPFPNSFVPRDRDHERVGSTHFDRIMNAAMGRSEG